MKDNLSVQEENSGNIMVILETISKIPLVKAGDNVGKILKDALENGNISLQNSDILIIAQKIISKAEGRIVNLQAYTPSEQAVEISRKSGRDARLVQLIIEESTEIKWVMEGTLEFPGIIIVRHKLGHVCSGAGIDASNTGFGDEDLVLLLPENPDDSAKKIADYLDETCGVKIGVVVIDTLGDRYRVGSIGKAIGVANVPARLVEQDLTDLDGRRVQSDVAFADSVAGLAMILMGQPNRNAPVVLIRGMDYPFTPTAKIKDVFYSRRTLKTS